MRIYCWGHAILRVWDWVEASSGEFKNGLNLFPLQMEPSHDFLDGGARFEVFKNDGNRQSRGLEHQRATNLARNAFHGGTL